MKMQIVFDLDADLIDVPQTVIDHKDALRGKFLSWLYDKNNRHKYWTCFKDSSGKKSWGLCYRSDAFVEWLNKKVLKTSAHKAAVLESHTSADEEGFPTIFF